VQVPDKEQDVDVAEEATKNVAEEAKNDTTVLEMVETVPSIVDDEFCSNESYSDKPTTTTSMGAAAAAPAPQPPPPSRGRLGGFDYFFTIINFHFEFLSLYSTD
jgi:hypothetical protein